MIALVMPLWNYTTLKLSYSLQRYAASFVPLRNYTTLKLETELSALQRRKLRLAPEMDRCGEPLY